MNMKSPAIVRLAMHVEVGQCCLKCPDKRTILLMQPLLLMLCCNRRYLLFLDVFLCELFAS